MGPNITNRLAVLSAQIGPLNAIATSEPGRGIGGPSGKDGFHQPGAFFELAGTLLNPECQKVMLLTGFNVAEGMPETDGPPGTAELARASALLGKNVVIVASKENLNLVRAALVAIAECERVATGQVPIWPAKIVLEGFDAATGAEAAAGQLLDKHEPHAVVAIELPSRTEDGSYRNMRGDEIQGFNQPVDEILVQAHQREIYTAGIGDGGNEAGTQGLPNVPLARNDKVMASAVPAETTVTAWNSNLGAQLVANVMLDAAGHHDWIMDTKSHGKAVAACLRAGAVDGCTRKSQAGAAGDIDPNQKTGVDGFQEWVHKAHIELMKHALRNPNARLCSNPFHVATVDSGAGGIIATENLKLYAAQLAGKEPLLTIFADFGHGVYGQKTPEELTKIVHEALMAAQATGVHVIATACNTLCTVLPQALHNPVTKEKTVKIPVINLIETTAGAIVNMAGNKRPLILSTAATKNSKAYPEAIWGKDPTIQPTALAAPEWAGMVNKLEHLSENESVKENVRENVQKIVDQFPDDITSVFLCCTHFPALTPFIREAMDARGLAHVPIVDPMSAQAEALVVEMHKFEQRTGTKFEDAKGHLFQSTVVTTGSKKGNGVKESVQLAYRSLMPVGHGEAVIVKSVGANGDRKYEQGGQNVIGRVIQSKL